MHEPQSANDMWDGQSRAARSRKGGGWDDAKHIIPCLFAIVITTSMCGCEMAGKAVQAGGNTARSFVGSIEPTGVVQDTTERKELTKSLRVLVENIDPKAVRQAVDQTASAAAKLSERIDALPVDDLRTTAHELSSASTALREQIEAARIDETTASVRNLAQTANDRLAGLNTDSVNTTIDELNGALRQWRETVERVEHSLTTVLGRIDELGHTLDKSVQDIPAGALAAEIDDTLTAIRTTADELPGTTARLDAALGTLHIAARVALGVLILLGACLAVWLLRLLRPHTA